MSHTGPRLRKAVSQLEHEGLRKTLLRVGDELGLFEPQPVEPRSDLTWRELVASLALSFHDVAQSIRAHASLGQMPTGPRTPVPNDELLRNLDSLLLRLDGWDVMNTTGDGPYWKGQIRTCREAISRALND